MALHYLHAQACLTAQVGVGSRLIGVLAVQFPLGTKCGTVANKVSATLVPLAHSALDSTLLFSTTLRVERQDYLFCGYTLWPNKTSSCLTSGNV